MDDASLLERLMALWSGAPPGTGGVLSLVVGLLAGGRGTTWWLQRAAGQPLEDAARALADHTRGAKTMAPSAVPVLRAGLGIATGQPVSADLASDALGALEPLDGHADPAPDAPEAVVRVGRALAAGSAPGARDVTAARRLLGDLAGPTEPAPADAPAPAAPDGDVRLEVRVRRGKTVVATLEVPLPKV